MIVVQQQTNNYSGFDQILTTNKTLMYDLKTRMKIIHVLS